MKRGVPPSLCQSRMGPTADRDDSHLASSAGLSFMQPLQVSPRASRLRSPRNAPAPPRAVFFSRRRSFTTSCSRMVSRCAVLIRRDQLLDQLLEADRRIDHHRLHVGEVLQMRIEVHRVEDAEDFLADLGALARRAADHLLVEDAAVDPPQEHEVGDGGHVDAGGQQIDRDGDLRDWRRCGTSGSGSAPCPRCR